MHQSFISNIKILGDIYDDFTAAILQLIRVLNYQANDDFEYYKKLLPENAF